LNSLFEQETIVRLGEGVQKTGVLSKEAMERAFRALTQYSDRCRAMQVQKIFAAGTSALREASNSGLFLKRVKEELDITIDVISGEEEASLSYLAVSKDMKEEKKPLFVVDVGGGSTEFIFGKDNRILTWRSLPLGSVRFTEKFLHSDPVRKEECDKMAQTVQKGLAEIPLPQEPFTMVAVGGTATALASVEQGLEEFDVERIHHFVLEKEALRRQLTLFRMKTVEERKKIPGLSPTRADVILAGGTILYMAMEAFRIASALVSCHGVRYGLLYKRLNL
jgi:exopolyphosphatase / guanosine-5'-triphosphate,3'-diphosphate pyrophosphatase